MDESTTLGIISLIAGFMCLGASVFNWMWFYRNWRVRKLDKFLGRTVTRIIYFLFGLVLTFIAITNLFL